MIRGCIKLLVLYTIFLFLDGIYCQLTRLVKRIQFLHHLLCLHGSKINLAIRVDEIGSWKP